MFYYVDFIANLAVARQGFPQMAIAACFGGQLLSILLLFLVYFYYMPKSYLSNVIVERKLTLTLVRKVYVSFQYFDPANARRFCS